MAQTNLQDFLLKLNKNLNILKEREAAYGSLAAPLSLLNQIEHYQKAIILTEQAGEQEITYDELQAELEPLNLELHERIQIEVTQARQPFTGQNPYRGLERFNEENAEFFFGRSETINTLLDQIRYLVDTPTNPAVPDLIAVLGASGSGKSSLVRAGLIPALRRGEVAGSDQWLTQVILPGFRPLDALAGAFTAELARGLGPLKEELRAGPEALHDLMVETLIKAEKSEEAVFVLVVDQFEELFTLCEQETERQAFLDLVLHACQISHNRSFVIITMRADFYAQAGAYKQLADTITKNQIMVASMTPGELREAILLPAEKVGLEMERELALALVQDTAGSPGALPLLQHALLELYNRRSEDNVLTLTAYQEIGGVKGALAHRADSVLNELTPEQRQLARNIFMRLTSLGEGFGDTRRRVLREELYPAEAESDQIDTVLQALSDKNARLVVSGEETVEVTHDALIQQWGTLRGWLEEDREALRTHRRLTETATEWEARGRDASYLYRDARLLEVEKWDADNPGEVNPTEAAFIKASRAAREQGRRRTQLVIVGLAIGLVAAVIGAILGFVGQNNANIRRVEAVTSEARAVAGEQQAQLSEATAEKRRIAAETAEARALAGEQQAQVSEAAAEKRRLAAETAEARAVAGEQQAIEAQQTTEAERAKAERQARISLAQSLAALGPRLNDNELTALLSIEAFNLNRQVAGDAEWLIDSTLRELLSQPHFSNILSGHNGNVRSVVFSPDGQTLASGSFDQTIRLWDLSDPKAEQQVLRGHKGDVLSVAFSPDGKLLASGGEDKTIRLWDLNNLETGPRVLNGHQSSVWSVIFSSDGQRLASGSGDQTIRLWDLNNLEAEPRVLRGHGDNVLSVTFSLDGQRLASGSGDETIRLWDLNNLGAEPRVLRGHNDRVRSVAFSPDGQRLASASVDETVRLWDLNNLEAEPRVLTGHEGLVVTVAFSPDGKALASGGEDETIRLWNLSNLEVEPMMLNGHEDLVSSVSFRSDGQRLASGSIDGTVRLWDLSRPQAKLQVWRGHDDRIWSLAFNSDSQTLATASRDRAIHLWDLSNPGAEPRILNGHDDNVWTVAFSPDGQTLASGSSDRTIRLWALSNVGTEWQVLSGHNADVLSVTFSPDGQTLASGSSDRTIRLWDLSNLEAEPQVLSGHQSSVWAVTFSSDGQRLASGSNDETIRLWDLNNLETEPRVLRGHDDRVTSVAFSPDGQRLASGSDDLTIRLWDLNNLEAAPRVLRRDDRVLAVAFSPDGETLASASGDLIRLWALSNLEAEPRTLRGHDDRVRSVAFSSDGKLLASTGSDQTVRLWIVKIETLIELGCQQVRRNLTQAERNRYLPGEEYGQTCSDLPAGQ